MFIDKMSDEKEFKLDIERIKDYQFRIDFDKESMGEIITDETEEIGGEEKGPNPARLLAGSVVNCLMASLTFCLKKKGLTMDSMKGEVTGKIERKNKRLRVTQIDVDIKPDIEDDKIEKAEQCIDIFEKYCIVTQSVRNGIEVNVDVEV